MESRRRTLLFREVNDRIYELLVAMEPDLPGEFLCECGEECGRHVELLPAAYVALRDSKRAVRADDCVRRGFLRRPRRDRGSACVPVLS